MRVDIQDFEACGRSGLYYGGNGGRKEGIVWNSEYWIVKFPGSTSGLQGDVPSINTAPISEWLGSHVYEMLGVPVQETVLGVREDMIVCACKDFTMPGRRLVSFHDLRNTLSDDEEGFVESPSAGLGMVLSDVLLSIDRLPEFREIPGVKERFWRMFVTDAFIRNIDRDNTNWGILVAPGTHSALAPVFDNADSFNRKRTEAAIERVLSDPQAVENDARDVESCFMQDSGKPIPPLEFMESCASPKCIRALDWFMERWDFERFDALLDGIPEEIRGIKAIPRRYKEYHHRVIECRYDKVFTGVWRKVHGNVIPMGSR